MSETAPHLALFDDVAAVADAIVQLRELGVPEKDMTVLSGVSYSHKILGRPEHRTYVPLLGTFGFVGGLVLAALLNFGTPLLYPMYVGGKPLLPLPPGFLLMFEMSMLGLLLFTFLGVIIESRFPAYGQKLYDPGISDGKIGLLFDCPPKYEDLAYDILKKLGASEVRCSEANTI